MEIHHEDLKIRGPCLQTLFLLVPKNPKAHHVILHENNSHLRTVSKNNTPSIDVGYHINSPYSISTLATLGRNDCDITLRPTSISRLHCSFEIDDVDSGIVMFYDRSHKNNTRVSGEIGVPFEKGRSPRKILVHPEFNTEISMGGVNGDLIKFKLEWMVKEDQIKTVVKESWNAKRHSITNPRKARTCDLTETTLPSFRMTRDQAFQGRDASAVRYHKRSLLGAGTFGKVWRVIDVDSGQLAAMKQIEWSPRSRDQTHLSKVRKEVELMRRAKHVSLRYDE